MRTKLTNIILALQPLFPLPVYFSVLTGHPALWASSVAAIVPLVVRYLHSKRILTPTPFDIPILLYMGGAIVGVIFAPDKNVAAGALSSTIASVLVYYGLTANSGAPRKYWLWTGGIICLITFLLSIWFLSQGVNRVLFFNQWAFNLFSALPKTHGPVLQLNTIGALLVVVIPPLFAFNFYRQNISLSISAIVLCVFFTGMLFLSDSGAGWLAFAVSLAFAIACWRKWLLWACLTLGGLLTAGGFFFYNKAAWLRATFSTGSLMSRITIWKNTITLLRGKIVFTGLGLGCWHKIYSERYGDPVLIVHNSYLQVYCDTGILGLIAMILAGIIFICLSLNLLKSARQNSIYWIGIGLIGSVIAGAVFAIFDTTYSVTYATGNGYIYLAVPLLWIGAALITIVHKQSNN